MIDTISIIVVTLLIAVTTLPQVLKAKQWKDLTMAVAILLFASASGICYINHIILFDPVSIVRLIFEPIGRSITAALQS